MASVAHSACAAKKPFEAASLDHSLWVMASSPTQREQRGRERESYANAQMLMLISASFCFAFSLWLQPKGTVGFHQGLIKLMIILLAVSSCVPCPAMFPTTQTDVVPVSKSASVSAQFFCLCVYCMFTLVCMRVWAHIWTLKANLHQRFVTRGTASRRSCRMQ